MSLQGGAAQRRKRSRNLPTTPAAILRMRDNAFPGARLRSDFLEDCWRQHVNPHTDAVENTCYRREIVPSSIRHSHGGKCVGFVTRATSGTMPPSVQAQPYAAERICKGGRYSYEDRRTAGLAEAQAMVNRVADQQRRHRRRARKR